MRSCVTLVFLVLCTDSAIHGQVPELGGMYLGITQTTTKSNFPETEDGLLPGDELSRSFLLVNTALKYDYEDYWWSWEITPVYWDLTAILSYAKDEQIENILFSSGLLGHVLYGRNFYHGDRVRAGIGLGFGEYGIETEALEAGYHFTGDLAAKADVLLTDSFVGRFRARYDITVGSLTDDENSATEDNAKPHFLSLDAMLIAYSGWFVEVEYWKILPRNDDATNLEHWQRRVEHMFQSQDPVPPVELEASRIFLNAGFKFYNVDSW